MTRTESDVVKAMKRVIDVVQPTLKAAGFRKRRHTFNRIIEPGLVQVIDFQLARYPVGDGLPSLRENLYGKFAVNLGVFVEEVYVALHRTSCPEFVREYHCEFRVRLGQLIDRLGDRWWPLDATIDTVGQEVVALITGLGFPWFELYAGRTRILGLLAEDPHPPGWPVRAPMALGVILCRAGDKVGASRLFSDYLADEERAGKSPRHGQQFVREVAHALGLDLEDEGRQGA